MKKIINKNDLIKILIIILVTLISISIRIRGIGIVSEDMEICLLRWFYRIKLNGGIKALSLNIGDYNMPYLTIMAVLTYFPITPLISIKTISIIFDYLLAFFCVRLLKEVLKEKYNKKIGIILYSIIVLLPTVFLNSAYWGQCDSIYVTFIIISLIYLIKERYVLSFVFLGISFAFKLQFIFVLPVYVLYYLSKKEMKIRYFFIIPLMDIIMCIPSIIVGKGLIDCLKIYFNQTVEYNQRISLNFPGIYNLLYNVNERNNQVKLPNQWIAKCMILLVGMIFLTLALYVIFNKVKFNRDLIIETAVWSVLICTFFLPYMHDRYAYLADIISIVYCIIYGKKKIYLPICIQVCSLYTYIFYLTRIRFIDIKYISTINAVSIILLSITLYKHFRESFKYKNNIN